MTKIIIKKITQLKQEGYGDENDLKQKWREENHGSDDDMDAQVLPILFFSHFCYAEITLLYFTLLTLLYLLRSNVLISMTIKNGK
jgi:hypothetical protein